MLAFDGYGAGSFTMRWPVTSGRKYQVCATTLLVYSTAAWPVVAGPWEATNGQTHMEWSDTNTTSTTNRYYRLQVLPPE